MSWRRAAFWIAGTLLALACASAALPQAPGTAGSRAITPPGMAGPSAPVVTHHSGTFNGKRLKYDAVVEPVIVTDAQGRPAARLVTISYLATPLKNPSQRPVLFAFNGGPISPSSVLHMGALGPMRVAIPDDLKASPATFRSVDNPYTVLDVADLVFFDPAGTGYSRVLEGVDPRSYFSNNSDAQQLVQLIVEWCTRHQRLESPKYLFGESYGTMRAAAAANQLQKLPTPLPLAGVVLMGQALNIIEFSQRPANVTSYIVSLPTIAATAWYHGKAQTDGKDFQGFMDEVQLFARAEYLTALFQGSALDEPTRERIAARLEHYTGLPASYYLSHALKITKERYRRELFKDRKEILGMTDARYVGPISDSGGGDPAGVVYLAYEAAFQSYLHRALGIGEVGEYVTQSPVTDFAAWKWDGTGTSPFADWPYASLLTEVFSLNPQFRVMVGNGWQDTQTTVGAAILAVDQSGWPRDRVSTHFYQGGHMAYSVEASLRQLTQDLRAFLTPAP